MRPTPFLAPPRALCALLALLLLGLAGTSARAQAPELRNHPGYADFDGIPAAVGAEPNVEVYIKGALLRLAAEASRSQDPELGDMLDKMRAIRVFGFETDVDWTASEARTFLDLSRSLADELEGQGWDLVARIREDGESVFVYLREAGGIIQGMAVMTIEDHEAVFVNIVGEIDPAQVGRIGRRFDIDALEDVRVEP